MIWSILNSTSRTRVDCAGERGRTGSCAVQFSSPRKASAPKGESVPIPGTQTVQQADLGNKIESSESSLVLRYKGRCANELAPSMTVILQSPSAPFARRWTEQPRPRGARDVRVALESRPASVAPREVPAGDSKPPRAPALDKIPPCRPSRLRRASPRPEARASAETENTPRGAARRPAPRRAPRFARLSPVPGTTRAFPSGHIARVRALSLDRRRTRPRRAGTDPTTRTRRPRSSGRWRGRARRRAPRSPRAARRSFSRRPRPRRRRRRQLAATSTTARRRRRARAPRRASSARRSASFPATPCS